MTKLLVVEDNAEYRAAAESFATAQGIDAVFAHDYEGAMGAIESVGAVLSDCFFPRRTGDADLTMGEMALRRLETVEPDSPVYRGLRQTRELLGPEFAEHALKNVDPDGKMVKDYITKLVLAMKWDPSNQPLGVLVADECKQRGIPVVLATSTYHHDSLTQLVQNYVGRIGVPLVDCYPEKAHEKATPEFWARAYRELSP